MKDMGPTKQILGMHISPRSDEEAIVAVTREVREKGAPKVQHVGCETGWVDIADQLQVVREQSSKTKVDKVEMMKILYAPAVGTLMYAMVCTRMDIDYVVGVISRFMRNLGREHWAAVKWIL